MFVEWETNIFLDRNNYFKFFFNFSVAGVVDGVDDVTVVVVVSLVCDVVVVAVQCLIPFLT